MWSRQSCRLAGWAQAAGWRGASGASFRLSPPNEPCRQIVGTTFPAPGTRPHFLLKCPKSLCPVSRGSLSISSRADWKASPQARQFFPISKPCSWPCPMPGKRPDTLHSTRPHDISRPGASPVVTDVITADRPESLMDKEFWPDVAPNGTHCQNGGMVRAAGFEPATSCV